MRSSTGKKRGVYTCFVCGAKYKRWNDMGNCSKVCEECYSITIKCDGCGAETKKYQLSGRPRRFCQPCRNTINGRTNTKIRGEKVSRLHKENPEFHKKMSDILNEHRHLSMTDEIRKKSSDRLVERWKDDEYRAKMSEMTKAMWRTEGHSEKVITHIVRRIRDGIRTDIEDIVELEFNKFHLKYDFNYRVGRYFIDFAFTDDMIGVECDGDYWHAKRQDRDKKRDDKLRQQGWRIIRLLGSDIKKDARNLLASRVLPFLSEKSVLPK